MIGLINYRKNDIVVLVFMRMERGGEREREKPVDMGKEPVFLWIIDAYCESLIGFRVYIGVSVPQAILPEPESFCENELV